METNNTDWKFFWRQLFVSSSVWMIYFLGGVALGAPTVVIPQLRKEGSTAFAVNEEMASWLSSVLGYSAIPWIIFLTTLTNYVGRKLPFLIVTVTVIASFVVFVTSINTIQLLISEIMLGVTQASCTTISIMIVTEYSSPGNRGLFLTMKSASALWGIWAANALGTFFTWKVIGIFGFICSLYPLSVIFWPESPVWLASRGKFEESKLSHEWLRGCGKHSKKELDILICSSQRKLDRLSIIETVKLEEFYKPVLLSVLMMTLFHFSGKFVCSMYALDIIKKITSSEATAYTGMLILDGVIVLSMYIGSILSKYIKRRKLFLSSSALGAIFLFIISLYLYLVKLSVISESKLLSLVLLALFNICLACGPIIFATSIYGEIIPLRFKRSGMTIIAFVFNIYSSTLLKLAPYMFRTLGFHGAFLFYGVSVTICTYLLYKYLPETKDKTLQEIENYFKSTVNAEESNRLTLEYTRLHLSCGYSRGVHV